MVRLVDIPRVLAGWVQGSEQLERSLDAHADRKQKSMKRKTYVLHNLFETDCKHRTWFNAENIAEREHEPGSRCS